MFWLKFGLMLAAGALLNAAMMFRAPEYAVISGIVFAFAIGLE